MDMANTPASVPVLIITHSAFRGPFQKASALKSETKLIDFGMKVP